MTIFKGSKADDLNQDYSNMKYVSFQAAVATNNTDRPIFEMPNYATTQRDNITSPLTGEVIYNTTTNKINFYSGSGWEAVTSA